MLTVAQHRPIIGRFSPSPTGHLHLGSLTTAVASFCHIKSLGGQWLLRMEDVDFERCKAQYSTSILQDLDNLGLHWDGEVVYQSDRQHIYDEFIDMLKPLTYACQCSRKQLQAYLQTHNNNTKPITFNHASKELSQTQDLNQPLIYPRLCLHHSYDAAHPNSKIRLCLPDTLSAFYDGIQGVIWDNPARSLGDVVIKRQNGMINYIFACAIDDGLQNISHIMRGLDILPMTAGQLTINKACQLPHADHHYHLPLLHNKDGQKLSKQNLAKPIKDEQPTALLIDALRRLKQPIPKDMMDGKTDEILAFAIKHWNNQPLIQQSSLGISDDNSTCNINKNLGFNMPTIFMTEPPKR